MSSPWRRILLEALILSALALTVGLSLNYRMVLNAFTGKSVAAAKPAVATAPAVDEPAMLLPEPVELDELDELLAAGALLLDARNSSDYAKGHLAGAVAFPLGEFDARLPAFLEKVPKEQLLVAYCNGFGCPDSFDLGVLLLQAGYQQVRIYEGGYPQWRDEGRPIERGGE